MNQPSSAHLERFLRKEQSGALESFPAPRWYPQQQEWILEPETSDSVAYNYPVLLQVRGRLDSRALELALGEIVRRHEVFRAIFQIEDGEQIQLVVPPKDFTIRLFDLSELLLAARNSQCLNLVIEDASRAFDVRSDLLLRATLVRLAPEDHMLLLTTHHIVCDDWSVGILVNELFSLYDAYSLNETPALPPVRNSYREFARHLAARMRNRKFEARISFWKEQLGGGRNFYHLPTDRPRAIRCICVAAYQKSTFSPDVGRSIQRLSQCESVSQFMVLAAAFQCVLARISGHDDIGMAICVANRNSTETELLVGPFSNRIILRTNLAGNPTFRELLNRVRDTALDAYANQDIPFGEVVERVATVAESHRNPLFQVLMILQERGHNVVQSRGLEVQDVAFDATSTRYDLNVWLKFDESRGLDVSLQYNASLFEAATMRRILEMYRDVLAEMENNPAGHIRDSPDQRKSAASISTVAEPPNLGVVPPRDEIEKQMLEMWRQNLGTPSDGIGIRQDFFDLGGSSLQAMQLFEAIDNLFHMKLPVSTLLEARTIEAQAKIIRGGTALRNRSSLVLVQPAGSRPPLFCIHTHTGNVLFCRNFPKYAGPDQPIYGLQSQAARRDRPHFSVHEMASAYLQELKSVQAEGPYHLFGYSFGGLVAFEIARQLIAQGHRVDFLGMFNTPAPGSLRGWPLGQSSYLEKRIKNELRRLRVLGAKARSLHMLQNAWNFSRMVTRSVRTDAWRLSARILKRKTAEQLGAQVLDVEHINIAAAKNYRPSGVFPGRIVFFLAAEVPYLYSVSPQAGWNPLACDGIEIVNVSESDTDPLEARFAKAVGDRLRLCSTTQLSGR
jgi:thioesterase domain-containing protein/acyl carrier protein